MIFFKIPQALCVSVSQLWVKCLALPEQGLGAEGPCLWPACGPPAGSGHRRSGWLAATAPLLPKGAGWALCRGLRQCWRHGRGLHVSSNS